MEGVAVREHEAQARQVLIFVEDALPDESNRSCDVGVVVASKGLRGHPRENLTVNAVGVSDFPLE